MLNTLLTLTQKECDIELKRLTVCNKVKIYNSAVTLTEILGLDKIDDYETRVKMRFEYIQKHPGVIFWDIAEWVGITGHYRFKTLKVSTNGDFINIRENGRIHLSVLKTNGENIYSTFRVNGRRSSKHRIIASTFLPKPSRLTGRNVGFLQINHTDGIKYNNAVSNLEWVTNQENQKHCHDYENYKEEEYFLFEIIIDNGFKGRRFVLPESRLRELNIKTNTARNISRGKIKNTCFGMKISLIPYQEMEDKYIGVPSDIFSLLKTNYNYFSFKCRPVIGTVLEGKHKGLEFSLFGTADIAKYFITSHVQAAARGERKSHSGCKFRFSTHREAIPLHGILTENIFNERRI